MKKAFFWYERAAESHLEEAFFALGECYEHGEGTEPDSEQAMTWYKKAYDCGGEYAGRASCRIALILEQCREPSEKLDKEILQWLQKSADEEFDWGILNLADAY
ncbi:tetratricopeptide repeat protein, partial [Allisonella histaminiformans]